MSDPKISIALTIQHEGGFVDNPNDPGGATKYGIEQRDMPDVPIKSITTTQASAYYLQNYVKSLYTQINSQSVLDKLEDMGVLFGVVTAIELLQRTIGVAVDGVFGAGTLEELNKRENILSAYKMQLHAHASAVVEANPKLAEFLNGWNRRIEG